jgi:hypothetical protein
VAGFNDVDEKTATLLQKNVREKKRPVQYSTSNIDLLRFLLLYKLSVTTVDPISLVCDIISQIEGKCHSCCLSVV